MEKKVYELKIDDEFARLIPPLAKDERQRLEESIKKEGCTDPLTVWNGTIIDGHNRYSICTSLGIPFAYEERDDFKDRNEVKAWIIERQLARRNLTPYQKTQLALAFEPVLKEQAKERQGRRNDLIPDIVKNSSQSPEDGKTRKTLSDISGVSHDTIRKVKRIDAAADDEMKKKLESGEISVNKAYNTLFGDNTPDTVRVEGKHAVHVEGKMADEPESFPVVKGLLEEVARNYLVSLEHILQQYTAGMVTNENNETVKAVFRGTNQEAMLIINKRIKEISE